MHYSKPWCKKIFVAFLFVASMLVASATVFVKTKGAISNVMDKFASRLEYTSELEVNGAPGVVSVYTLHDLNAIERLAKYIGYDCAKISDDGFRVKLNEDQGGGMLFVIAAHKVGNGSAPLVLYFDCPEKGTPQWLFPEISSPNQEALQFSVKDMSRNMTMCTYTDAASANQAIEKVSLELLSDGWVCATPGSKATSLFFAKGDSIMLVSATPASDIVGCTVLIMKKN